VMSELLDRAHIEDWRQVRRRIFDVEQWPRTMRRDQAREEFHRITNLIVLCVVCHRLFDRKLIPVHIVHAAQQQMWAMPMAEDALRRFIETSLSFYGGHQMESTNVALAVDLLHQYHDARQPFRVNPWPVKLRGTSFVVDPQHRKIGWRAAGG
jgi:hypothetical protein